MRTCSCLFVRLPKIYVLTVLYNLPLHKLMSSRMMSKYILNLRVNTLSIISISN